MLYQLSYLGVGASVPCAGETLRGGASLDRSYNCAVARVIQVRVRGLDAAQRDALHSEFDRRAAAREWRDGTPWLGDARSRGLLAQLFFDQALVEARESRDRRPLDAAGFVRIAGDEADALALTFIARDVSAALGVEIDLRDPDNPIAKLRHVVLVNGRLRGGDDLESLLVRRAIYRRMPDGSRMEMIPPHGRRSAFGEPVGDERARSWSFIVHDIRVVEPSFLDAEAEAMRIFRGFRSLPSDGA